MINAADVAVLALRLALALVLYVFLVVVVRMARGSLAREPLDDAPLAPPPAPAPTTRRAPPRRGAPARTAPASLRLRVLAPGESDWAPGQVLELHAPAVIGRAASADVQLADPTVSSRHAELAPGPDGAWLVRDLGSTNGTFVDGAPLPPGDTYPLAEGQQLRCGAVELDVLRS